MTRFPTLDRLARLDVPTLVIAGRRDPLVGTDRIRLLFGDRPDMAAVEIDGAHALNFTHPVVVAALITAQLNSTELSGGAIAAEPIDVLFDQR